MAPMLSVPLLVAALLATGAVATDPDARPSNEEWKEEQINEAKEAASVKAKEAKMAAVEKVTSLLDNIKSKIILEGEEEAASYNKFACFCKDTVKEKTEAVFTGKDAKETLTADIEKLESTRTDLDEKMKKIREAIEEAKVTMAKASQERAKESAAYTSSATDLKGALEALAGALQALKASKKPSLAQLQAVAKTVRTATLLADALGFVASASSESMLAMLQQAPSVPTENYKFHSEEIIKLLEELQGDFRKQAEELDKEEVSAVAVYDKLMQEQTDIRKTKEQELEDAGKEKAKAQEQIAMASSRLTTIIAELREDNEYLKGLNSMCQDQAKTWDQRSKLRSMEIATLTEVTQILRGNVAENTKAATLRFAQRRMSIKRAEQMAVSAPSMQAIEAEAEAADGAENGDSSFLQVLQRHQPVLRGGRVASTDGTADAVANLLLKKGKDLKSSALTSLASRIAELIPAPLSVDPFVKIRQLIQELIERLLQEAANETNQKGWCDKAQADAAQKRDMAAREVEELDGELARLHGTHGKLIFENDALLKEIEELQKAKEEAEHNRKKEKAENTATIAEAREGQSAIEEAIKILDRFYKTAAKESVSLSLAQQGPSEDAPDAGFAAGEAYTGAQGESGGVLGMMKVIESDFERTVDETVEAEDKAAEEHDDFLTVTGKALAQASTAQEQTESYIDDASAKIATTSEGLSAHSKILGNSIKELLDLKPVCTDTGMSYAERVANREQEMDALKKALCILEDFQAYGPGGDGGDC